MRTRWWVIVTAVAFASCGKKKSDEEQVASPPGSAKAPRKKGAKLAAGKGAASGDWKPSSEGFKFENYTNEGNVDNLTPAEVRRMFGDEACAYIEDGVCTLTPAAAQWMEQTNDGMAGGHCEGLAALALLFRVGKMSPKDFGAARTFDLELDGNSKLQREVAFWWATQTVSPMTEAELKLTPNQVVDRLIAGFDKAEDSWTLGMYMPDGSEGHATTPYAVVEHSETEAWILHYDNNYPGQERKIVVDRKANTWQYSTAATPGEEAAVYEGDAETKSLTLTPTSVRVGKMECPFCGDIDEETGELRGNKKGMRMITLDGGADLLIADEGGKRIGYANGKLVNEIAGAHIVKPRAARKGQPEHEPIYYVPTGKKLTATIDGAKLKKEEQTDVSLIAPGYTMGVYGIELEPGEKDVIEFSADWHELTYTTQTAATPDLEIGIETPHADYELHINASSEVTGIRVDVSLDAKAGTITVNAVAKDGRAEYGIEIRRLASDSHTQVFTHKGISAGPKDRFVFHYKDWKSDHTKLHVDVDHDGDGKYDEVVDFGDDD